jgi:hypothetical protein
MLHCVVPLDLFSGTGFTTDSLVDVYQHFRRTCCLHLQCRSLLTGRGHGKKGTLVHILPSFQLLALGPCMAFIYEKMGINQT